MRSSVNKIKCWLSIFILCVYINEQFLVLVIAARSEPGNVGGGNAIHKRSNKDQHQQHQLKEKGQRHQQQQQPGGSGGGGNSTRSQPGVVDDGNATHKESNRHHQQQQQQHQQQKRHQQQQHAGGSGGEPGGNSFKESIPIQLGDVGNSFKESATKQLGVAGNSFKESIPKQLSNVGNGFKKSIPKQLGNVGNSFKETIPKKLGGVGNSVKESMPKKLGDVGNSVKESMPKKLGDVGNSVKESIPKKLGDVGNSVKESMPKKLGGGKKDKGLSLAVLPSIGGKLATETQIGGGGGGGGGGSSSDNSGSGGVGSSGGGDTGKGSGADTPQNKKGDSATSSSTGGGGGSSTFNVKKYGARADGRNDDTQAFTGAWKAACASTAPATVFIPKGTYLVGPVKFTGPCKASPITVNMQGFLKASTDLNRYGSSADWFEFGWVDGLNLIGGGTFDGQGAASWPFNKCPTNQNCKLLPTNVKFVSLTNTVVKSITSLNSKFFHMVLLDCKDFRASEIHISAPGNSPNTDGIHMERSTGVTIANANIGTGDDCVSIGQGNAHVTITGVTCGPGHGISVGSLGRYQNEGDVNGLLVKGCTLSGTMNGIRIKTWANSPDSSVASNMTFEDIVVNNVANPIIIDQTYCPYASCSSVSPSKVKLSDITFKNIRGTTSSPVAVTLECSKGVPCQNVKLEDVHLDPAGGGTVAKSSCLNVQAKYTGTQIPPPCA